MKGKLEISKKTLQGIIKKKVCSKKSVIIIIIYFPSDATLTFLIPAAALHRLSERKKNTLFLQFPKSSNLKQEPMLP